MCALTMSTDPLGVSTVAQVSSCRRRYLVGSRSERIAARDNVAVLLVTRRVAGEAPARHAEPVAQMIAPASEHFLQQNDVGAERLDRRDDAIEPLVSDSGVRVDVPAEDAQAWARHRHVDS
jgi:hypothetical protein